MAAKRMFSAAFIASDGFISLSASAQALYFQLMAAADDEGVVDSLGSILRATRTRKAALLELIDRGFVVKDISGIVIIVHWYLHNSIRKDRKKTSVYSLIADSLMQGTVYAQLKNAAFTASEEQA